MDKLGHKHQSGYAIIVLIVILLIATSIGLFALRSSQGTLKKIGVRKTVTDLKYQSERGMQKALQRIQMIAANTTSDDIIATENDGATGATGGDYNQKTLDWLVDSSALISIPQENDATDANPACTGWKAEKDFDKISSNSNVVCNFLGVNEENIHVALVRKDDLTANGNVFGIFLINAIAFDNSGRRQITQGVAIVPYELNSGSPVLLDTPYLSNSKTVID